jgi:hypothetical protein
VVRRRCRRQPEQEGSLASRMGSYLLVIRAVDGRRGRGRSRRVIRTMESWWARARCGRGSPDACPSACGERLIRLEHRVGGLVEGVGGPTPAVALRRFAGRRFLSPRSGRSSHRGCAEASRASTSVPGMQRGHPGRLPTLHRRARHTAYDAYDCQELMPLRQAWPYGDGIRPSPSLSRVDISGHA